MSLYLNKIFWVPREWLGIYEREGMVSRLRPRPEPCTDPYPWNAVLLYNGTPINICWQTLFFIESSNLTLRLDWTVVNCYFK